MNNAGAPEPTSFQKAGGGLGRTLPPESHLVFQAFSLGMLLCHVPRPMAWAKVVRALQAARLSGPYRAAVDLAVLSRRLAPTAMGVFPLRGGDIRRAVEGNTARFMASIHVRFLEVFPTHEPILSTLEVRSSEFRSRPEIDWYLVMRKTR